MDAKISNVRVVESIARDVSGQQTDSQSHQSKVDKPETKPETHRTEDPAISPFLEYLYNNGVPKSSRITFQRDQETNEIIIEVLDEDTDEVIRRIPTDEIHKMMEKVGKKIGVITDQHA
jgi:flagellar protein FlaG